VVEVLRGISGNITRQAFRDQVYNTRMFVLDDLVLGLYSRRPGLAAKSGRSIRWLGPVFGHHHYNPDSACSARQS
jgi:hypothetical protein